MPPIRVLQVVECGGPGGTGEQVAAICGGLPADRFEVGLAFAARDGEPEAYRARCAGAARAFHIPEMTREISPARDARALLALRRVLDDFDPDAAHAHSSKAGALLRLACLGRRRPRVFYSPRGYSFLQSDRGAAARALYRLSEAALSRVGTVAAVSPSEAEFARGLGAPAVRVVCDAYLGEFGEPVAHEGTVFGALGRMAYPRNPDAWILLAQRLTDSRNGLRGVWIGGGEGEARARAQLENMNLSRFVEVTGWLPAPEARRRLLGLDFLVHYSRWEGLPNAVLEAMAAGLPVVASDIPGNRDAVEHGRTGLLARTETELLEACQLLADDPALRRRLGEAARERVRREFSRERMLAGLSALYSGEVV